MTQDAIGRLRRTLRSQELDGDGMHVRVRQDDLRTLLATLDEDKVSEEMIEAGFRTLLESMVGNAEPFVSRDNFRAALKEIV